MSYRMRLLIYLDENDEYNETSAWDVPKENVLYHEQIFSYIPTEFLTELGLVEEYLENNEYSFDNCNIPFSNLREIDDFKEWFIGVYKYIIRQIPKEEMIDMLYEDKDGASNEFWRTPTYTWLGQYGKTFFDIFIQTVYDKGTMKFLGKNVLKAKLHAG